MQNENLDSGTHGIMTAERNGQALPQVIENFSEFNCENCESDQVVAQHNYKAITTYERFIPCECGAARDGQAATQSSQVPYSTSADGYPDGEGKVDWGKSEATREDPIEGEIKIFCEDCYYKAIQDRQGWEDCGGQEEKVENSDEFTYRCRGCRGEVTVAEGK